MNCYPCVSNLPEKKRKDLSVYEMVSLACDFMGVLVDDIIVKRDRVNVEARQKIEVIIYENTRLTLKEVGKLLDRDHTTVIHSMRVVKDMCDTNEGYRRDYHDLKNHIFYGQIKK